MDSTELEDVISQAYDEYANSIFRHVYFRVHDREAAKDIVQQTFINTWEYLNKGKTIDTMKAFLFTTSHRLIIDYVRKQKKQYKASIEDLKEVGIEPESAEHTEVATEQYYHAKQVQRLIAQVKEPYKTALVLRFINELSPAEIATSLNISVSNASARISRGLKILKSLVPNNG